MTFKLHLREREKRGLDFSSGETNKVLFERFGHVDLSDFDDFNVEDLFEQKTSPIGFEMPKRISLSGNHDSLDHIHITNNDELDVLLEKIVREFSTGLPRDLKIDDGDLPLAENFVDWSYNPRFVGNNDPIYPFPKQIQIISTFFTEWCYNPRCTDVDYQREIPVNATIDEIRERTTYLVHGKCPKCGQTRLDIWNSPEYKAKRYTEIIGIAGQRSGKTAGINRLNAYQCHRMFKLNRPQKVFGTEESVWFESSFTATTFAKAIDNFYDPLTYQFRNNPWFKEYHKMLDYYGNKHGEQLYKILGETAYYRHRNYQFYPQSPDPANMRGATRYFVDVDELSHLYAQSDSAKKLNPKELHTSLRNSLFTLRNAYNRLIKQGFYDIPPPVMCNITSPRSMTDFGMKLYRDAQSELSTTYAFHYCLPGNTLIPTENGLIAIKDLHTIKNKTQQIKIRVAGEYLPVLATHVHYSGKKKTKEIKTQSGHIIQPSYTHPIKIFQNNTHVWKKVSDLKKGDLLCLNPNQVIRTSPLCLKSKNLHNNVCKSKYMNEGLAYFLGALIAEGCMWEANRAGYISIYNNNKEWLNYIGQIIVKNFDCSFKIVEHLQEGYISSNGIKNNGIIYRLYICSIDLFNQLKYLGVSNKKTKEKRASWFKEIPWCILQADGKSQLSFIASYIEADGWIRRNHKNIGVYSRSKLLLQQMQLILDTHGIFSNVKDYTLDMFSSADACNLYDIISPYLKNKHNSLFGIKGQRARLYGFPTQHVRKFINSRKQPRGLYSRCKDDNGRVIDFVNSKGKGAGVGQQIIRGSQKTFTYEAYEEGLYDGLFIDLKNISEVEYKKVQDIVKHKYRYDPIVSITEKEDLIDTYDITIESNQPPAFVANGFVVHNSVYQMNPNVDDNDAELNEIKRTDPEGFKRDYLAIPPSAHNAFVDNKNMVKAMIENNHVNAIKLEPRYLTGHHKNVKAMSAYYTERTDRKINKHSPKILALDAGSRHNSFAISLGHLELQINPKEPDIQNVRKMIDVVTEIIPKDGRIISFPEVYEDVIAPLINEFNVIFITADRWNANFVLQKASDDFDIPYAIYSCRFKDFTAWKGDLYSGNFRMPMPEMKLDDAFSLAADNYPLCFEGKPVAHAMVQMLTVENLMSKTVEKGGSFTDDIFRSLVLCNKWLSDDNLREELLAPTEAEVDPNAFVGVYTSMSGSTMSLSGSSINAGSSNSGGADSNVIGAMSSLSGWGGR